MAVNCFLNVLPHIIYGPGEDALFLTVEHGGVFDSNTTQAVLDETKKKMLCNVNDTNSVECEEFDGNYAPQLILFISQLISGFGQPLFYTLGTAYMDDNIKKSKTATFISRHILWHTHFCAEKCHNRFVCTRRFVVFPSTSWAGIWLYVGIDLSEYVHLTGPDADH